MNRLLTWFRKRLCGRPFRHTANSRDAIIFCTRFYRAYNLPPEVEKLGLARLEHGLRTYGPDAFSQMSQTRWLQETLEELLDAFNMMGGMLRARGEEPLPLSSLEIAILDVRARLNKPAVVGGASAPIVDPSKHSCLRDSRLADVSTAARQESRRHNAIQEPTP